MKERRKIPCGVGNWAELVWDDAYFYVDHTACIRELEKSTILNDYLIFLLTFCDLCWRRLASHYTIRVEPNLHPGRRIEAYVAAIVGNRA